MESSLYVIWCETALQDGHEEHAHIVRGLDKALEYINSHANPWGAINSFKLFKLGKEIPLVHKNELTPVEPVPPEVKIVYNVKGR